MRTQEHRAPMWTRVFKSTVWTAGIIAAAVALAYLILLPVAASKERAVAKRWADTGLPIADFIAKCPVQEDSPAAVALDASALKLGFSLRTNDAKSVPASRAKAWEAVSALAGKYPQLLESPQPPMAAPPEPLARFLSENAAVIQDIREKLHAEVPRWRMDLRKGFGYELPNLLGQLDLTRVLVSDCLAARAVGENARALDDLDAAWRLSEGLSERPELISQLIVIAMRKILVVAIRSLDGAPPIWQERLRSWNPERGLVSSFQAEASMWGAVLNNKNLDWTLGRDPSMLSRFQETLGRPYLRLSMASTQECELHMVQIFLKTGLCASEEAINHAGESSLEEIPRWNIIGGIAIPNLSNAWLRVKYLRIQMELTQKVLELKTVRDAHGAWPVQVPGIEKSFCPQEHWTYTVMPDGTMSIAYSGTPPGEKVVKGFRPPQEYKEGPQTKAAKR